MLNPTKLLIKPSTFCFVSNSKTLHSPDQRSVMDHQWRQLAPPPQGNGICPMCSISHFPFCPPYPPPPRPPPPYHHPLPLPLPLPLPPPPPPPPPPLPLPPPPPPPPLPTYHQTTRFPSPPPPPDYPLPDPYHAAPPFAYFADPNDPWQPRGSNFGYRESFPQQPGNNNNNNYYGNGNSSSISNGFIGSEFDRSHKRPRVSEFGSGGVFGHESTPNQGPFLSSSDNERRLKLIRDHGNTSNVQINNYSKDNNISNGDDMYSPFQPQNAQQNQPPQQYNSYLPRQEDRVFGGGQPLPPQPPPPPPLPVSPPPPLPMEPPMQHQAEFKAYSSPPKAAYPLFPVPIKPAVTDVSATSVSEQSTGQALLTKQLSLETPTIIDASHLFKYPHRSTRPEHIVIILRGLPGSGKSYIAKMIRDLEVENGNVAPRIHSMDDYFMTEVEKVEDSDASKSSSSARGKKRTVKKVMEYCYEPEMEEVYRDSMLKAFKKTIEDGNFKFVIVDDRNLRVADFAQFWAIAKRSGYEVYISEATYTDPAGCAARNVHGFTLDEIQKMAGLYEEAPLLYLRLDVKSLFHGDELKESGILEVDMDTEDADFGDNPSGQQESGQSEKKMVPPLEDDVQVVSKDGKRLSDEVDHPAGVKELGKSKWSDDLDEDDIDRVQGVKGGNMLTGLTHVHRKRLKSVHWSDQAGNTGFSIGIAKKGNMHSLVIGPGAGYNLKSNPLRDDDCSTSVQGVVKSRRQSTFQEQLRAERESFRAVFDRRRHRIGGLDLEEE